MDSFAQSIDVSLIIFSCSQNMRALSGGPEDG